MQQNNLMSLCYTPPFTTSLHFANIYISVRMCVFIASKFRRTESVGINLWHRQSAPTATAQGKDKIDR